MKNLAQGKIGKEYIVLKLDEALEPRIKTRLCEFGFVKGQKVKLVGSSLLGKTMLVGLRGQIVCLRRSMLRFVEVESV